MSRPPFPPFTFETATQKVRRAIIDRKFAPELLQIYGDGEAVS